MYDYIQTRDKLHFIMKYLFENNSGLSPHFIVYKFIIVIIKRISIRAAESR